MAATYALSREPTPFDWAILANSLDGVLRAGGCEAKRRWLEGRYALLVEANQQNEWERHYSPDAI